jgi:hypothetical protein
MWEKLYVLHELVFALQIQNSNNENCEVSGAQERETPRRRVGKWE